VERAVLLRRATLLSVASVVLSGLTGTAAVGIALSTGALSLLGFGFDAAIDSIASAALVWRFRLERRDPTAAERAELLAERIVGMVLLILAATLTAGAIQALLSGAHPATSPAAAAIPIVGLVMLPPLAMAKYRTARSLRSGALRADSILTALAAGLAAVSLISLALAGVGVTWADALGGLVIASVLVREGLACVGLSVARPVARSGR
jgi:divalent metal cation (Fe/Co/Zn/Cd) transporter